MPGISSCQIVVSGEKCLKTEIMGFICEWIVKREMKGLPQIFFPAMGVEQGMIPIDNEVLDNGISLFMKTIPTNLDDEEIEKIFLEISQGIKDISKQEKIFMVVSRTIIIL
jgi:hypothetical protein